MRDFIDATCLQRQGDEWVPRARSLGGCGNGANEFGASFRGDGNVPNVLKLDYGEDFTTINILKTLECYTLNG